MSEDYEDCPGADELYPEDYAEFMDDMAAEREAELNADIILERQELEDFEGAQFYDSDVDMPW